MEQIPEIDAQELDKVLEALLFVADGPVAPGELARALGAQVEQVVEALARLGDACAQRGIRLLREKGRYQLVSAPEAAPYVESFLGLSLSTKLSRAALEAVAIIAYRQPITRAEVGAIRGVDSDGVIRTLLARGVIEEVGRQETAGRPILYGTSVEFLQYFGIQSLDDLPTLMPPDEQPDEVGEPTEG